MDGKRYTGRAAALLAAGVAVLAIALPTRPAPPSRASSAGTPPRSRPSPGRRPCASPTAGSDVSQQFCGGAVVAPRIVLTAAHCVSDTDPDCGVICLGDPGGDGTPKLDPNDVQVVLNKTTLSAAGGDHLSVQDVRVQPGNNPNSITYDVGYLVLSSPTGLQPIKIAGPSETAIWTPGSGTVVSGYGTITNSSSTPGSDTLRSATVPVIPDSSCSSPSVYGSAFISDSMLCAGYLAGGSDACYGDSGGPLQAPAQGGIYRLVGLVSWGDGCGDAQCSRRLLAAGVRPGREPAAGRRKPGGCTRVLQRTAPHRHRRQRRASRRHTGGCGEEEVQEAEEAEEEDR